MLIDIRYDPVAPATNVWVNGVKTNENDIYGLLYPVRHCLIQTYLKPSGSWPGLKARLNELRRSRSMAAPAILKT